MAKKKKKPSKSSNPRLKKYKHFDATKVDGEAKNKKAEDNASVFDRKSSKQKFEILGRKIKGKSCNVLKARGEGFERRERTLLVEHKLSGKANAFVDLRFGELDNNLTQEEKAIGRLARTRLGQLRKKRKNTYSLEGNENDDDEDGDNGNNSNNKNLLSLTHLGKPLDDRRIANAKFDSDSDDEDGTRQLMNEEMTRRMHFGGDDFDDDNGQYDDDGNGGFRRKGKKSTVEGGDDDEEGDNDENTNTGRRKTKKEVMDELIAKSKMYKAEKAKQRDDDEELLDKLDEDFKVISRGGLLQGALRKAVGHLKPTNKNTSLNILESGLPKDDDIKSDYDKITKSLALDARAHAAEIAKTSEQMEARQKRQLEEAERARVKRMRGDLSDDDENDETRNGDDDDAPLGGYALRRHKARKLEKEEGEGGDPRSTARAGGEDLDDDFAFDEDDEDDEENEESSDESDEGEDEDDEEDSGEDDLDETGKFRKEANKMDEKLEKGKNRLRELGILNDGVEVKKKVEKVNKSDKAAESDDDNVRKDFDDDDDIDDDDIMNREILLDDGAKEGSDDDDDDDDANLKKSKEVKEKKDAEARDDLIRAEERMDASSSEIPYTFEVPETYETFETLLTKYTSDEVSIVLTRMRACNAPSLATENRRKIQTLLGLLLQRFETLCGNEELPVADLNVITKHISEIATQVPFYAVTAAKARIENMGKRLQKALRLGETGLPPPRTILLLGLFADIFSSTDKQHAVTTPASLYIGNVLSHCAVRSTDDANYAVILCALASAYVVPAMRIFPEALNLLTALIHASGESEKCKQTWNEGLPTHLQEQCGGSWLRPLLVDAGVGKKSSSKTIEVLSLAKLLSTRPRKKSITAADSSTQERVAMLRYAVSTLGNLIKPVQKVSCAPEMLQKVQITLNRLIRSLKTFGKENGAVYNDILKMCEAMRDDIEKKKKSSVRLSLAWHTKSVEAIKQFNPMYEEDGFQKGRDYDPNRERAENRKLKKELRKEARGTVRELRKDNQFMHHAREQEKAAEAEERDAKHKEVLSFLEKQESDFKSGGQGGLIVKNKRRAQGASKNGNRRRF